MYKVLKSIRLLLFILVFQFTLSCTPINYLSISVPEEGGIKFAQFTVDEENARGPNIQRNPITNVLEWYAAPMIAVSPDGAKIAFTGFKDEKSNMYIKSTAGGKATIQRTFRELVQDMAFTPDGTKIAFTDVTGGDWNIFQINATEGAAVQQITTTSLTELGPSFAPDGKSIYFAKSDGNRYYIWSVNTETALLTQYSEGFTPAIAKDGRSLVITRNNKSSGRGEIWLIDLVSGSETLILSDLKKGYSSPQISPDGNLIVCVGSSPKSATTPENLNIYTIKLDGTRLTQLTFHPGHDVSPVWGVDGKAIYFLSQRGNQKGKFNVWRMDFKN